MNAGDASTVGTSGASLSVDSAHIARVHGALSHTLSGIALGLYAVSVAASGVARVAMFMISALPVLAIVPEAVAIILFLVAFTLWFVRPGAAGRLTVANGALRIEKRGSTQIVPLNHIESAFVVHHPPSPVPTLEILLSKDDAFSCSIADAAAAHAMVAALGFGPGQKRMRIPLTTPRRRLLHPLMGLAASYIGSILTTVISIASVFADRSSVASYSPDPSPARIALALATGIVSVVLTVGSYLFLKRLIRPPEITIGDDGISYRSGRKTRFLSRAQIHGIDQPTTPWMPVTIHNDGAPLVMAGVALDSNRRDAAAWLARERLAARAPTKSILFARNGRSLQDWRAHIRQVLDSAYRTQGASLDEAENVLRSAEATDDERLGAAIALRTAGHEPTRIRIAAEASARPEMREALAAVAEQDNDEILEQKLLRARI